MMKIFMTVIGERIEQFQKYQVAEISIDKINMDEYELDDDYVDDYVEKYKQLGTYPPIVLGYFENNWDIILLMVITEQMH